MTQFNISDSDAKPTVKNKKLYSYTSDDNVIYPEKYWIDSTSVLFSARNTIIDEVKDIYNTRNYQGWDGYDALPITGLSKKTAKRVVRNLSLETASPDVVPTNSGGYSLEWEVGNKYLVIEIDNNEVSCVFIDADKKRKKTLFIEDYKGETEDFLRWVQEGFPIDG